MAESPSPRKHARGTMNKNKPSLEEGFQRSPTKQGFDFVPHKGATAWPLILFPTPILPQVQ